MVDGSDIRASTLCDLSEIERLYHEAFPGEDLVPLVQELLRLVPPTLSLVASVDARLAGNVILTACSVSECDAKVALLGPLVVAPQWQRKGIGRALVSKGLKELSTDGFTRVYVLGDPAYYRTLGFVPEDSVKPPYPLPNVWAGAWQSIGLGSPAVACHGELGVPPAWRKPDLWMP